MRVWKSPGSIWLLDTNSRTHDIYTVSASTIGNCWCVLSFGINQNRLFLPCEYRYRHFLHNNPPPPSLSPGPMFGMCVSVLLLLPSLNRVCCLPYKRLYIVNGTILLKFQAEYIQLAECVCVCVVHFNRTLYFILLCYSGSNQPRIYWRTTSIVFGMCQFQSVSQTHRHTATHRDFKVHCQLHTEFARHIQRRHRNRDFVTGLNTFGVRRVDERHFLWVCVTFRCINIFSCCHSDVEFTWMQVVLLKYNNIYWKILLVVLVVGVVVVVAAVSVTPSLCASLWHTHSPIRVNSSERRKKKESPINCNIETILNSLRLLNSTFKL